ncbi:glycoside hydrolase family 3 C-terminal domain-containing protein [Carboxylicivirga sp. A043]|uniref:glycoside hydrolase family 3 N-terminal domain-containing protein n=1 Tax=Carboxylicivirga litoralis TaxID=2816963 RepID=UPI0021CB9648|nr:glycoside hydrolase family 3 N-terminal domain-containing protein [Carboxylicivirga sp. A043]MCU4157737.1 glycoside hydrolase family 3 C-terminal domain-containing protein [Carboxylicivirga sp. A043]
MKVNYLPILIIAALMALGWTSKSNKPQASSTVKTIYHKKWIDFNKNGQKDIYEDPSLSIESRVEDLLSQMTMEEKTCQMVTLYGYGRVAKDELPTSGWKQELWKDGLGNIDEASNGVSSKAQYAYPHSKHVWALNEIQKFFVEETRLGIPVEFTNEGIRGLNHIKATSFPAQIGIGCTWNKDLVHQIGKCIGSEGYALGYNNIYSPVLDVARDQRWGRIVESFGEDPFLVSEYGINLVNGLKSQGVVSTLKHFAVYSAPKGGRDGNVRLDPHIAPREMHQIYLYPFKRTIQESEVLGIMSSYNDYDGIPVSASPYFLTDLLRQQYGFKGYVVSDSDAVIWIYSRHKVADTYKEAVRQSVEAGLNVRTTFNHPENFVNPLRELINDKQLSMEVINQRVKDVLYVKFREGLFDAPYRDEKKVDDIVRSEAHLNLALKTSRESIVLLKNENSALPLNRDQISKILVCGPNANAKKSSISRYGALGVDIISPLEGIRAYAKDKMDVDYALGCEIVDKEWPYSEILPQSITSEEQSLIDEAVNKAQSADVIIAVLGEDERMVGENLSRTSLDLPGRQNQLLKALIETGKPVITVLINGRPLSVNYADKHSKAILTAWFPGEFGGQALADVLFGEYNPGGKLSTTWPATVGQIPINFPYKPFSQAGQFQKGPHGTGKSRIVAPLYPFGHGLSYSNFTYSNLQVDNQMTTTKGEVTISFEITNDSDYAGDEVPQLYFEDTYSSVITYQWQLRGFDRIHLAPGETRQISFTLKPEHLTLLNNEMQEVTEPGLFNIAIGASSQDIRLKGEFTIE